MIKGSTKPRRLRPRLSSLVIKRLDGATLQGGRHRGLHHCLCCACEPLCNVCSWSATACYFSTDEPRPWTQESLWTPSPLRHRRVGAHQHEDGARSAYKRSRSSAIEGDRAIAPPIDLQSANRLLDPRSLSQTHRTANCWRRKTTCTSLSRHQTASREPSASSSHCNPLQCNTYNQE